MKNNGSCVTIEDESGLCEQSYSLTESDNPQPKRNKLVHQADSVIAGEYERAEGFKKAKNTIASFVSMPEDWDSYGGKPSEQHCMTYAIGVLQTAESFSELPPPAIAPIGSGAFIEWRFDDQRLGLYLEIDSESVVYCVNDEGHRYYGEDPQYSQATALTLILSLDDKLKGR